MPECANCRAQASYAVRGRYANGATFSTNGLCSTCVSGFLAEAAQVTDGKPAFRIKGKSLTVKYIPLEGANA